MLILIILSGCSGRSGAEKKNAASPDISDLEISEDLRKVFSERRGRLTDQIEDGVVIISSGSFPSGGHCEYRVNDNFYYLTGFDQPMSVVVMEKGSPGSCSLFLRERSRRDIIYNGGAQLNEEKMAAYGFDTIVPYSELQGLIGDYVGKDTPLYIDFRDWMLKGMLLTETGKQRQPETLVREMAPLVEEMRVFKDESEISRMQKAIDITGDAFVNACRICRPGMYEFEIEAMIEYTFHRNGAARPAFSSITGSGPNTVTLHYSENSRKMEEGDLLLTDIGAEYGYYAADISRTIPVNGHFTKEQREIYELVLKAQKAAIDELHPGSPLYGGHAKATAVIVRGLFELGLLTDTASVWQKEFYTIYQINHYLGLNVHDAGNYGFPGAFIREYMAVDTAIGRPLEKGMVLTVEPGIYLREDGLSQLSEIFGGRVSEAEIGEFIDRVLPVYEKYENIGVRIEDDVLLTETGHVVLSQNIPKEIDEIEIIMGRSRNRWLKQ
ncbi:MAG: aminopeptidase P N-terminal domain-containing protein [Bacteroidales bacterium]|nr:aminopeptidase P N-terminal domain-containing protein [Bacteroidales bacterium]MDT8372783.1 aminopeptidase P N-terminal domain-containing protein [Bacteroidales bacterium]